MSDEATGGDEVRYRLRFADGSEQAFSVDIHRTAPACAPADAPEWTRLDVDRCPGCPLADQGVERCPVALDVVDVVTPFRDSVSFARAHVTVETKARTFVKDVDVQTALRSLLGLIMASSACPILGELRALAEHHLPFATPDEVTYRVTANHLLKQYVRQRRGEPADFTLDDLRALYAALQEVNRAFVDRLRHAARADANLNAVVLLFSEAALVEASLDDDLSTLEHLFSSSPK